MSAVELIKKLIEQDEERYNDVRKEVEEIKVNSYLYQREILAGDAAFLSGRISGLKVALRAIEGEK